MKTRLKAWGKRFWRILKHPEELSEKQAKYLTIAGIFLSALALTEIALWIGTIDFSADRFFTYYGEPVIFFLNFLPCLVLVSCFYFVTNRLWLSFSISAPAVLLLCFINYFKVALRGDPFRAIDIMDAGEGLGILDQYELKLPWILFVSIALWLGITFLLWRYQNFRISKKYWYIRLIGTVLCFAVCILAWNAWYTDDELYEAQENYEEFNSWRDAEYYAAHGTIYSFLNSIDNAIMAPPEGYSAERAQELLSPYADVPIPENEKVNVIVTMLESFCDLSQFEQIEFTKDPYAQFHELLKECYTGTLITDAIGGSTVITERSFITGYAYPHPSYSNKTNSHARYFKSQGYQTDGSHPGHTWFYSRQVVNERFGFDRYLFMENHYQQFTDEEYGYDHILMPELARIYEQEAKEPYFSFSVTFQNHSPYDATAMTGTEYISHEGISNEAYCTINNYLNSVNSCISYFTSYIDTFRDDEEPVVMLFFGDHKPVFGTGNIYYEELGINVQELDPEGCRNVFTTPYFIWANDAAKEILDLDFSKTGRTISPMYLMPELFDFCGWEGSAWMQYLRSVREVLPVMHRETFFMVDGELTKELTGESKKVYEEFLIAQYYMRNTLPKE